MKNTNTNPTSARFPFDFSAPDLTPADHDRQEPPVPELSVPDTSASLAFTQLENARVILNKILEDDFTSTYPNIPRLASDYTFIQTCLNIIHLTLTETSLFLSNLADQE